MPPDTKMFGALADSVLQGADRLAPINTEWDGRTVSVERSKVVVLDTHALVWQLQGSDRLKPGAA